ncbi:helix-turn-helix domain-containing protein [Micromonospora endophytica]|uniref:Transcriptional regulator n=1 Tax=Micromonospora endophytica TaxID=515350 RepID=A0A2W2BNX5_9ACTN|nr:helix-turn-helix transcriptional regulator [Micromonospora endophytica]PZF87060.1 transcriptional regulator [Micromonospora endophytica]RIW41263.1 XRE family transcriptional regulator [Micromonospora endophytica]BCJ57630.1 transcriptional regulator [Micromonospora endophytica]
MPVKHESFVQTLRAQWLGQQMRKLREQRGFTLKQAAEFLERDFSSVARWERAEWPFRRGVVTSLLDLYGEHDGRERNRYIQLAEDAWRTDRWDDDYDELVDASFIDFPWLESRAEQICSWDAMLMPGLMQTRHYAEAVIRNAEGDKATDYSVGKWLQLRLDRQRVIDREPSLRIAAVIDESVLRRPVGGAALMRGQLRHLGELLRRPNIDVRVMPSSVGLHSGLDGSFWLFRMPKPYPEVAYAEHLGGRFFMESPKSKRYALAYDRLREAALDPQESAKLIATIGENLP